MLQTPNETLKSVADFALSQNLEIPESAMRMAALLLCDTIGVAAGAIPLESGRIARELAVDLFAAGSAQYSAAIMFDGRRCSLAGAAYAAATQIDNLDAHDGFAPVKGHIGCAAVPALFAFAETLPQLSGREALRALVVAYEIAARAGLSLHASVSDYHTSGAWNALGVAALGCRLTNASRDEFREALGIAEYHGPRSQMMREIANPSMLHDGSGMGALVGVMATLQAKRGFTGAPAITVEAPEAAHFWADLGRNWTIEQNYIKPYPICRWAHAAIDAVRKLKIQHGIEPGDVASLQVRTFREAACLFPGMPETTSQAQYSLAFAVATMLVHGRIAAEHVDGQALADKDVAVLVDVIDVVEDDRHNARFPQSRWSDVVIRLRDGKVLHSGDTPARGGVEEPMSEHEIREKFLDLCRPVLPHERAQSIWQVGQALLNENAEFSELAALVQEPVEPCSGEV